MPLLPTPTTQVLEDHFFGAGNWGICEWFMLRDFAKGTVPNEGHFPATVEFYEEIDGPGPLGDGGDIPQITTKVITEEDFNKAIQAYAELLPDRTYQDLIEDMDAADVDACIQIIFWEEIRLS